MTRATLPRWIVKRGPVFYCKRHVPEAQEAGILMAGIACSMRRHGHSLAGPAVILSGGETMVFVGSARPGQGGRNTEFLLALTIALRSERGVFARTDGIEEAAGAVATPDTIERARAAALDPRPC